MFRYLAFVWNAADPKDRAAAHALLAPERPSVEPWRTVCQGQGFQVRCAGSFDGGDAVRQLTDGRGVVLGSVFAPDGEGGSRAAAETFEAPESRAICATAGQRLIEHYWGRYVAVFRTSRADEVCVLRDPSAGISCYALRLGAIDVYCSRIEDVLALGGGAFRPDWSYVVACLCLVREHCRRTGLEGVSQLVGGERARHRNGQVSRECGWDPLALAAADPIDEVHSAQRLAHCTRDVVRAWGACYRSVLLSLSGGLDSSIMLACLADAGMPQLKCFHYHPPHTDLDERRFARLAAESAGVELLERPRPLGVDLASLRRLAPSAEPTNFLFYLEHSRLEAELAAEHGAAALFIGYGGDQLFYQERAQWAPADLLHRDASMRRVARALLDAARVDELSVWYVLAVTLREALGARRWSVLSEAGRERPLLEPAVVRSAVAEASCLHPLTHRYRHASSATRWHVHQVMSPFDAYDPFAAPGDAVRIAPLLSQPLMEVCLRIAPAVHSTGGWSRAVARRAFHSALPPEIRNRRDKGGMEAHARITVERNRPLLGELLLDGELVRAGLLARRPLERALAGRAEIKTQSGELLEYACLEAWLQCWHR